MRSELVSPTPWSVGYIPNTHEHIVRDADGKRVAWLESLALSGRGAINEANAAYIVEAVNAHERLMAEVERLRADNRWKSEVLGSVLQWLTNLVVTDSIEGMDALVDNVRDAIGEE